MEQSPAAEPKWEGKVCTRLKRATAAQIWPLFRDFFNLHKWFPGLAACYGVHGNNGEPGCIRYCGGFSIPPTQASNGQDRTGPATTTTTSWSTERLLAVDDADRSLSYEIVDCNVGFKSYVSTVKIVDDRESGGGGCVIEWGFSVEPVEGLALDDLVRKYEVGLQKMAQAMEDALAGPQQQERAEPKWKGQVEVELKGPTADQAWAFLADFCSLDKWLPSVATCHRVEGELGRPGLVRYCATAPQPSADGAATAVLWAKEKLLSIDPLQRCLSYEIADNNLGLKAYVATFKVFQVDGGSSKIEWSFVSDPMEGGTYDDFVAYLNHSLQSMGKKMEEAVLSG